MTRLITLLISSILFCSVSFAIAQAQTSDPTAPSTVVEYGGPDLLYITTGEGEPLAFTVELANTPQSRERGMMHRDVLGDDAGMLFDFGGERIVNIWMENTILSLDIIYIRSDGTIAKIIAGAVPFSRRQLPSDVPVLGVLEIKAGQAAANGIHPGDMVHHAMFGTELDSTEIAEMSADSEPENGN